jgi:hypothetical protein
METINQLIEKNLFIFSFFSLAFFGAMFFWCFVLQDKIKKMQTFNEEFFKGGKIKNIDEILLGHEKNLKILDKDIQELYAVSNEINNLALKSLHKFAVVRFNPFKDVGGNQSFSIAFLDGKDNGLTITALYTKEGTRVYSKTIAEGKSIDFLFSEEEKKAIEMALAKKDKVA